MTSGSEAQDDSIMGAESGTSKEDSIHPPEEPTIITTESSFHPNQDAFSSTPATARVTHSNENAARNVEIPSWSTSLESPFIRLSREVENLSLKDEIITFTSSTVPDSTLDEPTPSAKPIVAQKSLREGKSISLREKTMRHQLYSVSDMSSIAATSRNISPLKPRSKPKTPIPKDMNPYIPPGTDLRKWDGVIDLRDPSTATPRSHHTQTLSHKGAPPQEHAFDEDEDSDTLPPGMSPPVMMSPIRRQKAADHSLLAPTPVKNASVRIKQDILRSVQKERQYGGTIESSLSTMPTPPSFSQYQDRGPPDITDSLTDPSFSSMMRRVGLEVPALSVPGFPGIVDDSATPVYDDSDDSIMDDYMPAPNPSTAFLMATQGMRPSDDDSFDSNQSTDSLNDEEPLLDGAAPVHPFAGGIVDTGDDSSDSFEDYPQADGAPTETLFGVAPRQRQAMVHPRGKNLRMLGQELLNDPTATDTYAGEIEESPTPAGCGGNR